MREREREGEREREREREGERGRKRDQYTNRRAPGHISVLGHRHDMPMPVGKFKLPINHLLLEHPLCTAGSYCDAFLIRDRGHRTQRN